MSMERTIAYLIEDKCSLTDLKLAIAGGTKITESDLFFACERNVSDEMFEVLLKEGSRQDINILVRCQPTREKVESLISRSAKVTNHTIALAVKHKAGKEIVKILYSECRKQSHDIPRVSTPLLRR